MKQDKKGRVQLGRKAEQLVADFYEEKLGFELIHQNLRLGPYEIDLVVEKQEQIRIIEVRSSQRSTTHELAWTLVGKKTRSLKKGIRAMQKRGLLRSEQQFQVDAAFVQWLPSSLWSLDIWYNILPADLGG